MATEADIKEMKKAAVAETRASVAFAEASPFPTIDDIYSATSISEVDHDTPAGRTGRHFFND